MKVFSAIRVISVLVVIALPVWGQLDECRIDFQNSSDGTVSYSGATWNLKGYSSGTPVTLVNTDGSATGGATLNISNYDDHVSSGCWNYGSPGWIYGNSGTGADHLIYVNAPSTTSTINLANLQPGLYRIDLIASFNAPGYVSNYAIAGDYGAVRNTSGVIVDGYSGQNYNPQNAYTNGWYLSWSDISPNSGNITISIWGNNHNMLNAMRVLYTGDGSLPVNLSLFTAQCKNNDVLLCWETASEVNCAGFVIHRSQGQQASETIAAYPYHRALTARGSTTQGCCYEFIDTKINPGQQYQYELYEITLHGQKNLMAKTEVQSPVKTAQIPMLLGNYPNPFNPATRIEYYMPEPGNIELSIYNLAGQHVCTLINGVVDAGYHHQLWNGSNDQGNILPAGIYFARLNTGQEIQTINMMLVK